MLRVTLSAITLPVVIIHLFVLYFWMFDWEQLVTRLGLVSWIGSILVGMLIYSVYHIYFNSDHLISKRVIFVSTLMTIFLGVIALAVWFITSSMP